MIFFHLQMTDQQFCSLMLILERHPSRNHWPSPTQYTTNLCHKLQDHWWMCLMPGQERVSIQKHTLSGGESCMNMHTVLMGLHLHGVFNSIWKLREIYLGQQGAFLIQLPLVIQYSKNCICIWNVDAIWYNSYLAFIKANACQILISRIYWIN